MLPLVQAHPDYANEGNGSWQDRRDKNGSPGTRPRAKPRSSPPPEAEIRTNTPDPVPVNRLDSSIADPPVQSGGQAQRSDKPEPPPFDRPPLRTDGSRQQDQSRAAGRSTTGSSTSGSSTSREDQGPGRIPDQDANDAPRGRADRSPPVLHRPQDSRRQSDDDIASGPPVLRRGSERTSDDPRSGFPNTNERTGTSSTPESGEDEPIRLEASLVNIPVVVSDRAGRFIPRLTARDFNLYEDGARQEINSFATEEVAFNVALLIDVSPSVATSLDQIHDAAIEFVRQLRPQDKVMVISFDRRIRQHTPMTGDRRLLENAIRSTATGSGTSVYDAVFETVSRRLEGIEGRKAMILFSDGEDTTSNRADYDDAVNIVTESDVLVYCLRYPSSGGGGVRVDPWPRNPIPQIPIPFPWPWPRRRGGNMGPDPGTSARPGAPQRGRRNDFLEDLATAGGGPVFDADTIGDLSRLAAKIADELRHVYVLSYYPSNPLSRGGYRSLRIRVNNRDDIAVRHRRGYNAK